MKKLSELQTAQMIRVSARPAPERRRMILDMVNGANANEDPFMRQFGLNMAMQMVELRARVLEPQRMIQGDVNKPTPVREGAWNQDSQFYRPAPCPSYGLLSFVGQNQQQMLEGFCSNFSQTCNLLGMEFPAWPDPVEFVRSKEQVQKALEGMRKQSEANGNAVRLVIVVMQSKSADIYSEVKRWGDIEMGLMTQCVLQKNARNVAEKPPGRNAATAVNLAMKVNIKMGGINNALQADQVWAKLTGEHSPATLFLGVDVTHPGIGDTRSPSIGCVVGNVDLQATRWGASMKVQRHRREHIVYMQTEAKERLMQFFTLTKKKPERIIIFRDGVSEGQFMQILEEEMGGIRRACLDLDPEYKPTITFIVVQKRHHTRLFCKNDREGCGRAQNVPPGTVVDTLITHPCEFDFFLCSHQGIMGTSRPTHYYVLHDENGLSADELQMASYQLCHLYGRCNRVVSIPAPVYYADLCCTRARYHVRSKVDLHSSSEESRSVDEAGTQISDGELRNAVRVATNFLNEMYFI
jgi:eukaryotic translation initiation factor 2C